MSLRQLPIFPTIVVLIAAGIMVWLGIWQLGRADEKAELIAKYEAALASKPIVFPRKDDWSEDLLFRRSSVSCAATTPRDPRAGRNSNGAAGWMHVFGCVPEDRSTYDMFDVAIGWSRSPTPPDWFKGEVKGWIVQGRPSNAAPRDRLVLMLRSGDPVAGLQPLAKPDPRDLPNNHLAYAGQWFFFALTALVIYWFAIQNRLKERRDGED